MKMQWVAPPNWPATPVGFEPPQGWQPDPTWPAPPQGWQFWQPVGVDVHAGLPWYRRKRWITAGVIAAVVLVIIIIGAVGSSTARPLDTSKMNQKMETFLSSHGDPGATVSCPSGEKAKANNTFLCPLSGVPGFSYMQVTVLNSSGDITFQTTQ